MKRKHANWEEILDYLESGEPTETFVSAHLRTCDRCARLCAEARKMLKLCAAARLPQPPAELIERATERALAELSIEREMTEEISPSSPPAWARAFRALGEGLAEIQATMVADSLVPSHAVRGGAPEGSRTMIYNAQSYSVAISLRPDATGAALLVGQVVPKTSAKLPPGGRLKLCVGHRELEAVLSRHGEFVLRDIPAGLMRLGIVLGRSLIRLDIPSPLREA
ncbi:MAG: hypothetical protein KAY24_11230 [Candidatus Eisenbacteria sp.]|nr:hypothetical protein [Candidatus Eisenbacteria bacterium]